MAWTGPLREVAPGVHEIPADYRGKEGNLRMRVPARIVADATLLPGIRDDLAPEQLANVASLPGIVEAAWAMPDMHWGYGFPIGGVAAFDPDAGGIVSPGGVGFDINCGVRLLGTGLDEATLRPRLRETIDALYDVVPAGMGSRGGVGVSPSDLRSIMSEGALWAREQGFVSADDTRRLEGGGRIDGAEPGAVSERALVRGRHSLGSLGSGNHFLELQVVDAVVDEAAAKAFGLGLGDVLAMIHTGSRGLGHQVCQDHVEGLQGMAAKHQIDLVDRQLACAPLPTPEAQTYLGAMAAAANFAFVNRSILAARAGETLARLHGAAMRTVYDVCHNIAKWEEHEVDGRRRRVLVHRKGATRAFGPGHPELPSAYAAVGQPVLVPGDMGRASYVLAGRGLGADGGPGGRAGGGRGAPGGDATPPARAWASCCHGAGRQMSRTQAKKARDGRELVRDLWQQGGIYVRAVTPAVAAEEAPEAYKDVDDVVHAAQTAGLASIVARLRPLGVVKG